MACGNDKACPCRNDKCERRGRCCDCVASHLSRGNFPACFFTADALDAKVGRDLDALIKDRGK